MKKSIYLLLSFQANIFEYLFINKSLKRINISELLNI